MFDTPATPSTDTLTPAASASASVPARPTREWSSTGMNEPGIFKGCAEANGPLPHATKDAILAYLGKPNAASWERLRHRAIAGATTIGEAWTLAAPAAARRYPTSAELIRAMRVAAMQQLTRVNRSVLRAH